MLARRNSPLIFTCVLACLSACAGDDAQRSRTQAKALERGLPASTQIETDSFGRRDAPPAGVQAQLEYEIGGNGPCTHDEAIEAERAGRPQVAFYRDPIAERALGGYQRQRGSAAIGDLLSLCLLGFDDGAIEISIIDPRGERTSRRLPALTRSARWSSLPGDALGEYRVTARRGSILATSRFEIGPPRVRGVRVVDQTGDPGDRFRIVVVGFEPGQRALLQLYRVARTVPGLQRFDYATTLPVTVGSNGQALVRLKTKRSDSKKNCYVIVASFDPDVYDGRLCLMRDRYDSMYPEMRSPG